MAGENQIYDKEEMDDEESLLQVFESNQQFHQLLKELTEEKLDTKTCVDKVLMEEYQNKMQQFKLNKQIYTENQVIIQQIQEIILKEKNNNDLEAECIRSLDKLILISQSIDLLHISPTYSGNGKKDDPSEWLLGIDPSIFEQINLDEKSYLNVIFFFFYFKF